MFEYVRREYHHTTRAYDWAHSQKMSDLLRKQRNYEFLTKEEKDRIQKESRLNRIKNFKK